MGHDISSRLSPFVVAFVPQTMSSFLTTSPGIQKSARNRVADRKRQALRIQTCGHETMAPCTNCARSNLVCKMLKGNVRCSCCTLKNMKCDGQFSEDEFDLLEKQKEKLRDRVRAQHEHLSDLALSILRTQKSIAALEKQLGSVTKRQSDMVLRHSEVLDALDAEEGYEPDVPEPSGTGGQPNALFAFDDAQLEALMTFETNLDDQFLRRGSPSASGEFLVPKCSLSRRILTI